MQPILSMSKIIKNCIYITKTVFHTKIHRLRRNTYTRRVNSTNLKSPRARIIPILIMSTLQKCQTLGHLHNLLKTKPLLISSTTISIKARTCWIQLIFMYKNSRESPTKRKIMLIKSIVPRPFMKNNINRITKKRIIKIRRKIKSSIIAQLMTRTTITNKKFLPRTKDTKPLTQSSITDTLNLTDKLTI